MNRCFLISHAHLDHVNTLVLSAGSLGGSRKSVYATHQTLQDLEGLFADRVWPNLASWKERDGPFKLLYSPRALTQFPAVNRQTADRAQSLHPDGNYKKIFPDISVLMMPLSHGKCGSASSYESSAFFIRHDPSCKEFLFFGAVESDNLAATPRTIHVWRMAARKIPHSLHDIHRMLVGIGPARRPFIWPPHPGASRC